ncbi:hypothetical protein PUN28_014685 [Cardiocondyla obscurior]|uniref:Uncharacterized protein n=1 Tax=Cardiocondyla obscurior TaxID=286306 RepID=A0AAW2EXF8_9HYME
MPREHRNRAVCSRFSRGATAVRRLENFSAQRLATWISIVIIYIKTIFFPLPTLDVARPSPSSSRPLSTSYLSPHRFHRSPSPSPFRPPSGSRPPAPFALSSRSPRFAPPPRSRPRFPRLLSAFRPPFVPPMAPLAPICVAYMLRVKEKFFNREGRN